MPLVLVQYKQLAFLEEVVEKLSKALPKIVAPNLNLSEYERLAGGVLPEDIIVRCTKGGKMDTNEKDIGIIIFAHDFPERKENLEERKDAIIKGIHEFLATNYERNVSGFVWILLAPSAFGQL
ncbi:MAG: hypothetical protein AB1333_03065 [Patescibacteria group bacterium]